MHKLLLVEDALDCQVIVTRALMNLDIEVITATTLESALTLLKEAESDPFDLVILDLGLPDGEGLAILERIQENANMSETSVFLLTGKDDLSSKVSAFHLGAEDYLVKPANPIELRARVEMRLRKIQNRKGNAKEFKRGMLTLEPSLMKVRVKNDHEETEVELTGKEFKILYRLALQDQKAYSRADLVKEVWGPKVHVLERTVDSHICSIRRKLGESFIECIPGVGYRFSYPEKLRKSC